MNVLFKSGTSTYDQAVKLWTRSLVSHCELELINGNRLSAHPSYGVAVLPAITPGSTGWRRLELSNTWLDERSVLDFAYSVTGSRYDWSGIMFSQFLNIHRDSRSRWFCSELTYVALIKSGLFGFGPHREPSQVSPGKLLSILGNSWESLKPV